MVWVSWAIERLGRSIDSKTSSKARGMRLSFRTGMPACSEGAEGLSNAGSRIFAHKLVGARVPPARLRGESAVGYGNKRVRNRRNDALARVAWQQLEVLLATYYRGQGYDVEHTGTAASASRFDGGVDLKLRRAGEYVLV